MQPHDGPSENVKQSLTSADAANAATPHEEGEPETIFEPTDAEHYEFVKSVAAKHGFPLSDWQPTIPDRSAAKMQCSDPFAKGGDRHWFWWADAHYIRPGLYLRRRRILRVSMWLLRPRYSWNVRGYGRRWT